MATLFLKDSSNYSTATFYTTAGSYWSWGTSSEQLNTTRYIAFTPSGAGTMLGAMVGLSINPYSASSSITVTLQQYSGGAWADVTGATCTKTHANLLSSVPSMGTMVGAYFGFTTPATITTDANTWRLKVAGTAYDYLNKNGSNYQYCIVLDGTASISASDTLFVADNITLTVDQSITLAAVNMGAVSTVSWGISPAASYTVTITTLTAGKGMLFTAGDANNAVPAANKAILNIGTFTTTSGYLGDTTARITMYGNKPTYYFSKLNATANNGQKNIVTTEDMSSYWSAGDTLVITGRDNSAGYASDTIASISGTTVTMTNNLGNKHYAGFVVWNQTRFRANCGVEIQGNNGWYGQWHGLTKVQGCAVVNSRLVITTTGGSADTAVYADTILLDTIMGIGTTLIGINDNSCYTLRPGGQVKNVFAFSTWSSTHIYTYCLNYTFSDVYNVNAGSNTGLAFNYCTNCTMTDVQNSGGTAGGQFTLTGDYSCTFTRLKALFAAASTSQGSCNIYGANLSFINSSFDGGTSGGYYDVYFSTLAFAIRFTTCNFGQNAPGSLFSCSFAASTFATLVMEGCSDFTVNTTALQSTISGSYVKAHEFDGTANDHRSWWTYGKMVSAGTGLSDTTVHTAGGFAIRFEPLSSSNNLYWEFNVPTGNIQNKTMMVGVWCKINSATYYAGTHQLPRLTIDYDNGTTAYVQAAQTTDWQFLPLPFTPTTTYGQITVTLSGRTDATTTNAYVYWDDFKTLYPAETPLNTQTLDLWADALPVTPPLATVLSANDVWSASNAVDYGANTMGEVLDALPGQIKYIDGGEIPIY